MRILIAEDDLTSRTVLTAVLKKQDHEVEATVKGMEAWQALQQPDAPKLVILDWMMPPEMDGLEVVRRVRGLQTDRPTYIIMLTIKNDKENIVKCLDAGADDYIAKPYDLKEHDARVNVGRRILEMQDAMADKVQELQKAMNEVRTLRGIIPICASCKMIRDDRGYWNQVEAYVRDHNEAEFSHGICPECIEKLYPEFVRAKTEVKS